MDRLKRYLEESGVTQTELASQVGVKQPTVWEWLHGDSQPSVDNLRKLSSATGLSIDELLSNAA